MLLQFNYILGECKFSQINELDLHTVTIPDIQVLKYFQKPVLRLIFMKKRL